MKITTKGQVTIPQEIREQEGLLPGSDVEFVREGGRVYLRKTSGQMRGWEIVQRMIGKGSGTKTTDEIMAMTRGED
jgi:AbrB family looped-hinge helix DNA binding protein